MYIKEIDIQTFGGISNKKVEFSNGLNVIYGVNESGKSTVIAFVKFIFYGISGKKTDFRRYIPLSGEPMCGSITVCDGSSEYEIFRTSKGAKSKRVSVINKTSGEMLSPEEAQNIGKILFSLGEDAFLNTLFVSNISNKISGGDGEIFSRLSNLCESGDESTSYEKIASKIDEDILSLSSPRRKNAVIPLLEGRLSDLSARLKRANESGEKLKLLDEDLKNIKNTLDKKIQEKKECELSVETAKRFADRQRIFGLKDKILSSESELEGLESELKRLDMGRFDKIKSVSGSDEKRFLTSDDAAGGAEELILKERLKNAVFQKKAAILCAVLSLVLTAVFAALFPVLCIISGIFLALGIAFYAFAHKNLGQTEGKIDKIKKQKEENRTFAENFLKKTSLSSKESYISLKNEYTASLSKSEVLKSKIEMTKKTLSLQRDEFSLLLNESLNRYGLPDEETLFAELKNVSCTSADCGEAEINLKILEKEILDLQTKSNKCEFEIYSLKTGTDDILSLEEQLENTYAELSEKKSELETITAAKEILEYAASEQQNNFAPSLAENVSKIFGNITNGAHTDVIIDKTFGAHFKSDSGYADEIILSKGALDQLYFAIRFGIIDMINEKNAPVFLDDVFSQYDDFRLKTVFSYLCEYAKHTQVIISACRKGDIPKENENINIINL